VWDAALGELEHRPEDKRDEEDSPHNWKAGASKAGAWSSRQRQEASTGFYRTRRTTCYDQEEVEHVAVGGFKVAGCDSELGGVLKRRNVATTTRNLRAARRGWQGKSAIQNTAAS